MSIHTQERPLQPNSDDSTLNLFFNAHHAPAGAFATFTLGDKGPSGGLGLELGGPANEDVYIGVELRDKPGAYHALPFFRGEVSVSEAQDFDVESTSGIEQPSRVFPFEESAITRSFGAGIDEWIADDLTFRIISPAKPVPDPEQSSAEEMRFALVPAVLAELTIDNRSGSTDRKAFFGYSGSQAAHAMRPWSQGPLQCVGQGCVAIGCADEDVYAGSAFQPEQILNPRSDSNHSFMLGRVGLLVCHVPAGEVRTFRFAIGFFREGTATSGLTTRYLYRRYFEGIEDVLTYALAHCDSAKDQAEAFDRTLASTLSPERGVMLAQAIRSYYGSTQALELPDGSPIWIVNEGEYRMMNTLDLTIDQAFFELQMNPWTVRSELDFHLARHSYVDSVRFPGSQEEHPGGLAFTHDVGVANVFAEPGRSAYELAGLTGCFSYMSCEELVNWVLTACLYHGKTGDDSWLSLRSGVLVDCLRSLMNRDHPDRSKRNGVMGLDSSRCEGGSEITTYDSLDASLGQARNNVYLAVKTWGAYVLLEATLRSAGMVAEADVAASQAKLCAQTVCESADDDGVLPAVLGEGVAARIVPAIEGLVFPWFLGMRHVLQKNGPYGDLLKVLERHLRAVLRPGTCLFADGGWRLSSTSRNSWLSKIYLCQVVAEQIFGLEPDAEADRAHLNWLMSPDNRYFAWSDQMLEGRAVGSRYYPRGVTAFLWLRPSEPTIPSWHTTREEVPS